MDIAGFHLSGEHLLWGIGLPTWFTLMPEAGPPYAQWGRALPAIPLGLGLGRIFGRARTNAAARAPLLLFAGGFAGAAWLLSTYVTLPFSTDEVYRYAAAVAAIAGCVLLPVWRETTSRWIEQLLLAMYILHLPIAGQVVYRLQAATPFVIPLIAEVVLVAVLSLAAAWCLRLTRLRRVL